MSTSDLVAAVWDRLDDVLDPCSTFTEHPQSVVDLGLIDEVSIDDGHVTVHLLPTNQLCMYVPHMADEIDRRLTALSTIDSVSVEQVTDAIWTQDRMTESAYRERHEQFQRRVDRHDLTPAYDGQEWVASRDTDGSAAETE